VRLHGDARLLRHGVVVGREHELFVGVLVVRDERAVVLVAVDGQHADVVDVVAELTRLRFGVCSYGLKCGASGSTRSPQRISTSGS
jgi:hypothetical protein